MIFWLDPVPPFRLEFTAWAIRRRPENRMDRWNGTEYRRVLAIGDEAVQVTVTQHGPRLRVEAVGASARAPVARRSTGCSDFQSTSTRSTAPPPRTRVSASWPLRYRGVKPPRFPTVFEALVNGIACQQLSLAVGITLLNRLSETCGLARAGPDGMQHAFPRPADLAAMSIADLRSIGFSRNKARALIDAATAGAHAFSTPGGSSRASSTFTCCSPRWNAPARSRLHRNRCS